MKMTDIDFDFVVNFLKLDDLSETDEAELQACIDAAKQYTLDYTGISEEELNNSDDLTMVYLTLIADFYDNRNLQTQKEMKINVMQKSILDLHRENFLAYEDGVI